MALDAVASPDEDRLKRVSDDLRQDCEALYAFYNWTICDQIPHLHFIDFLGMISIL